MGAGETDLTAAMTAEAAMELARSSGVRAALHSALSKFDSLDAFFAAGEKPPAVAKRVFEEMRPDLDALGLDAKALHAAKGQAVAHVGKAFGSWKGHTLPG